MHNGTTGRKDQSSKLWVGRNIPKKPNNEGKGPLFDRLKMSEEAPMGTPILYPHNPINYEEKEKRAQYDFFQKHHIKQGIAGGIVDKVDHREVYRWDRRPPETIIGENRNGVGFEGTQTDTLFNRLFGGNTVYAARDMQGAMYYLGEKQRSHTSAEEEAKGNLQSFPDEFDYHLYKINTRGLQTISWANRQRDEKFHKINSTYDPTGDMMGFVWGEKVHHARQYAGGLGSLREIDEDSVGVNRQGILGGVSQKNNEIQINGPIPPVNITHVKSGTYRKEHIHTPGTQPHTSGTQPDVGEDGTVIDPNDPDA